MLQNAWPVLLILASSLVSCRGTLPARPKVPICMVSAPDQGCICSTPDGKTNYFLTWDECDKQVAMPPSDFQALANYIIALERLVKKSCKVSTSVALQTLNDITSRHASLAREQEAWSQ